MLVVPLVVGVVLGGPVAAHLPLALLWFVGYFAFYAVGQWLRARFKRRWWPPVRAYSIAVVPCGVAVLLTAPELVVWVPAFVPLVVVSLACSYRRRDRSLLNDGVTVLAASLMLLVAVDAAGPVGGRAWVAFALVLGYFLGTVLYVKTMIRERGNRGYRRASVAYHLVLALAGTGLVAWTGHGSAVLVGALLAALCVRATVLPGRTATPLQVGLGEIVASVALTVVLLLPV